MSRDRRIVGGIVLAGFAARAAVIWIMRPEFVGWFNHSCYYWVQTRGLLLEGRLPYGDLPLTFILYAGAARLLQALGVGMEASVINASRALMSLAPALLAVPAYGMVRRVAGGRPLTPRLWALVAASAFLPLTLAHVPELLQKNALGMLFLAGLMLSSYRLLDARPARAVAACAGWLILIAVTHLGTLAAALLYGVAAAAAVALERGTARQILAGAGLLLAGVAAGLGAVRMLDAEAFQRIMVYARTSLPGSLLGCLFSSNPPVRRPLALLAILAPLALLALLLRLHRGRRGRLAPRDRAFWLAHTLFAWLLVLPILDLDLVPRLVLFLPLSIMILLAYGVVHVAGPRTGAALTAAACLACAALCAGEAIDLALRSPDKGETRGELEELKSRFSLSGQDLVITRYGIAPICNWFLGTRASLITSFRRGDLRSFRRVFVLNPAGGGVPAPAGAAAGSREEAAYWITRRNVPLPETMEPLVRTDHLTLYRLEAPPAGWLFDEEGRWAGFGTTRLPNL